MDLRAQVEERVALVGSVQAERLAYDYDNRFLDGNTRDDGTTCGFGGCLYTRPADRDDTFTDFAGRLGVEFVPRRARGPGSSAESASVRRR